MRYNKLIPIGVCTFIFLAVNTARAEYYFVCSPPPIVKHVYMHDRPSHACVKKHHKKVKSHYKKHKHHYVKKHHRSSYKISVYYMMPPPCYSCATPVYEYPAPCSRCRTGYWSNTYYDRYYEVESPYYYSNDHYQDMRTDDDIRADMNIDE